MKVALVTGVAGGIGLATAKKLLENNIAVVGMDVLDEMKEKLEGEFTYFKGDLSNKNSRENYVKLAMDKYGKIVFNPTNVDLYVVANDQEKIIKSFETVAFD